MGEICISSGSRGYFFSLLFFLLVTSLGSPSCIWACTLLCTGFPFFFFVQCIWACTLLCVGGEEKRGVETGFVGSLKKRIEHANKKFLPYCLISFAWMGQDFLFFFLTALPKLVFHHLHLSLFFCSATGFFTAFELVLCSALGEWI